MNSKHRQGKTAIACAQGIFSDEDERCKWRQYPAQIISIKSLAGKNLTDATFRWLNRESHKNQEANHEAKIAALRESHAKLGITAPFVEHHFTGSGSLNALLGKASHSPAYFIWLEEKIWEGLPNTPSCKTLYVVFCTKSRLMRPMQYDHRNSSSWDYTKTDHDCFSCWLNYCFGDRAKNIVFVILEPGTPTEERGVESKLGMYARGNMGGRPSKKSHHKKILLDRVLVFAKSDGMNARQIADQLKMRVGIDISKRTIQVWLHENGCSKSPGRPRVPANGNGFTLSDQQKECADLF